MDVNKGNLSIPPQPPSLARSQIPLNPIVVIHIFLGKYSVIPLIKFT